MEHVAVTRRSRNHKRKKRYLKKRRREHNKFEVRSAKRQRLLIQAERGAGGSIYLGKEKSSNDGAATMQTMQAADSFWKNYRVAQEWQKRHSVTWWRSRCFALEYENQTLKEELRSLACRNAGAPSCASMLRQDFATFSKEEVCEETCESDETSNGDNFEFLIDRDTISFLEQSVRHKMELRKKRESESLRIAAAAEKREAADREGRNLRGGAAWSQQRNFNAKLLYGQASPTILAMETALQTTVDRHKDKTKPRYWPIIPLKRA